MKQSPSRPLLPLVLVVLALLLLILNETGRLTPLEGASQYVLAPLQRLVHGIVGPTDTWFQTTRGAHELRTQVTELQATVDQLTAENIRLREYQAEVQQLRALLNFVSEYPIVASLGADVVSREGSATHPSGRVIGTDPNAYMRYIIINVGSDQGVRVGMPVVSGGAVLVGRIAMVGPKVSRVKLLDDSESAVAVLVQSSRATGLLVGQADGTLHVDYVPQDENVNVGDIVLTSGLGGTLPKGLVVGQVADVKSVDYEMFQSIIVRPALDFSRLEIVLVITSFENVPLEEETAGGP